ncbi:MAG: precorrin-3B synthase [Janthinobacterium lividum]
MSAADELRVGWCPGALRPMLSGDGLIVRVKPRGMALPVARAIGIAAAASRHGNGLLDLTARANLQIRGVTEASLPALTVELDAMGLLDADAGAEARRNLLASPLIGLDPAALFDIRPTVAALESALAGAEGLDVLPSKFGIAVSDGGAMPLGDVSADLRFEATRDGGFALRLDGDDGVVSFCSASDVSAVALRLARGFVAASAVDPSLHRMRDLVKTVGAAEIFAGVGLDSLHPGSPSPPRFAWSSSPSGGGDAADRVRLLPHWGRGTVRSTVEGATEPPPSPTMPHCVGRLAVAGTLGVAAPFGRLDAAQFDALARGARRSGASELRMTPWRALLVPDLAPAALDRLAETCAAAGLIVDPADPRLRVAACAGAPGCRRGTTPVLDDAARWAKLLGPGHGTTGIALHVSGCAKGCAHPGAASLTLVGTEGRYALVADGTAADVPVASGLDAGEAYRLLKTTLSWDRHP